MPLELFGLPRAPTQPVARNVHFTTHPAIIPDFETNPEDTELDYTCTRCSKRNCRKAGCLQAALKKREDLMTRDDLKLFKYHLTEGAHLGHMRSTPLFRSKNVIFDAIRKAADNGTWQNAHWLTSIARVRGRLLTASSRNC